MSKRCGKGDVIATGEHATNESGATMLETSLILLVFLICLGAIFDVGVGLYQYNILRHTTNKAARDITTQLAVGRYSDGTPCNVFRDVVRDYLGDRAAPLLANAGTNARASWEYSTISGMGPLRSFRLRSEMPLNCFFICRFFPSFWRVGATSISSLESTSVPSCCQAPTCNYPP